MQPTQSSSFAATNALGTAELLNVFGLKAPLSSIRDSVGAKIITYTILLQFIYSTIYPKALFQL